MSFFNHLEEIGYPPNDYLNKVKAIAKKHGYDPTKIEFSDDNIHKLQITTPDNKIVRFGANLYGDYHLWTYLYEKGIVKKSFAERKKKIFNRSHGQMQKIVEERHGKKLPYSANQLALTLLW